MSQSVAMQRSRSDRIGSRAVMQIGFSLFAGLRLVGQISPRRRALRPSGRSIGLRSRVERLSESSRAAANNNTEARLSSRSLFDANANANADRAPGPMRSQSSRRTVTRLRLLSQLVTRSAELGLGARAALAAIGQVAEEVLE